jgi:hypothetical protein
MNRQSDRAPTPAQVAPGVWRWTAPHPQWRNASVPWTHDVASFALSLPDELVLVDPLLDADEGVAAAQLERLDQLVSASRSVAIVVTIPYHVRSSEPLYDLYSASVPVSIHGHPACAKRLRKPELLADITAPDAKPPAGARVFRIGSPVRNETPVYFASHHALAFGDAIVGVDGELRVWEVIEGEKRARWYRDRFLPTLRSLLDADAELVLVTHGPAVLGNGKQKLERALTSAPWHYG